MDMSTAQIIREVVDNLVNAAVYELQFEDTSCYSLQPGQACRKTEDDQDKTGLAILHNSSTLSNHNGNLAYEHCLASPKLTVNISLPLTNKDEGVETEVKGLEEVELTNDSEETGDESDAPSISQQILVLSKAKNENALSQCHDSLNVAVGQGIMKDSNCQLDRKQDIVEASVENKHGERCCSCSKHISELISKESGHLREDSKVKNNNFEQQKSPNRCVLQNLQGKGFCEVNDSSIGASSGLEEENLVPEKQNTACCDADSQCMEMVQCSISLLWRLLDSRERVNHLLHNHSTLNIFLDQLAHLLRSFVVNFDVRKASTGQHIIVSILGVLANVLTSSEIRVMVCERMLASSQKCDLLLLPFCKLLSMKNDFEFNEQIVCLVLICLVNMAIDIQGATLLRSDEDLRNKIEVISKSGEEESAHLACELYAELWGSNQPSDEPSCKRVKMDESRDASKVYASES